MKTNIVRIVEISYSPVVIVFLILFLFQQIGILSIPAKYELFAYILPVLAIPTLVRSESAETSRNPFVNYILFGGILFALGIRLIPLVNSPVPLGYDPGFYKYTMELYFKSLPGIPETQLATWIKQMFEQGLFVLSDALHIISGTSALDIISYLFPVIGAFLILPLFVVTRSLFNQRVGLIASLLYAVSYTQYTAFTMLYFINVLGLIFLLLAIYALENKKDWLMALMAAALGIYHRPEFLLFVLILIPYFLLNRRRSILLAIAGTTVLIVPFWISRWELYFQTFSGAIGGAGTFFNLSTYSIVSLAYLPFAAIGIVYLVLNKKFNSIFFLFLITCLIVVFRLIFFDRFIIMLDLAVVIVAAVGADYILLRKNRVWAFAGTTALVLILTASGLPSVIEATEVRPQLSEKQLQAVEWIRDNTEKDAYVLATSNDAPWVLGWSNRRVLAPGLFEWYIQSKDEWFTFLESNDPEVAEKFLDVYHDQVYIYYSKNTGNILDLGKFQPPYFREMYDNDEAVIYKYLGG